MFLFFALSNPKCKQIMSFCLKLQLCPYLFTQVPQCVHKSNNTTQKKNSPKKEFMLTLPILRYKKSNFIQIRPKNNIYSTL